MQRFPLLIAAIVWSLLVAPAAVAADTDAADNELTTQEKKAGWRLLFNGKDHAGWKCNNGKPIATPVEDGCLLPYKSGGYVIVHGDRFGDFIFKCDVRWEASRCNSGIFFRIEDPKNPVHTGFEVQVLSSDKTGTHHFGSIYDLAATTKSAGKETGEWNTVEIQCRGPHLSVKVNGELVCQMNCDDYDKPGVCPDGRPHKYKLGGQPRVIKDYARVGYLGFQDHGQKVWYKNVKILELK